MKVLNVHTRTIHQPIEKIAELLKTLATKNDLMLATDMWPPMILDHGLQVGSKGGHGPIRYFVQEYKPDQLIQFTFTKPKGFNGFHKFEMRKLDNNSTELRHTIDMNITGSCILKWAVAIRWLHDAFIEDAFNKVENLSAAEKKKSQWSVWVKLLRILLKPRRK
jgi:hypothetical protein